MRIIITEEQFNRFSKSSQAMQNGITKYLNLLFSGGERTIGTKNNNYGNLSEHWCIDGNSHFTVIYYFEDGQLDNGKLIVSNEIVDQIKNIFSVKKSYALHIIEEWYDDVMIPKFEELVNEKGLGIDEIMVSSNTGPCTPKFVRPDDLTDEEMIDYIVAHTLFKKQDVIRQIENGKDLDVMYANILYRDK
jgi:hypothetical protein